MFTIAFTPRQEKITEIVQAEGPITGEQIAERLAVTRAALRSDLAILIMAGILDARPKLGYFYVGKASSSRMAEEIQSITIRDIQSQPVVVPLSASAYDAVVTMFLEDVGSVFVVESGLLAGIISRKDLLKVALGNSEFQKIPVKMVMTSMPKLVIVTADESVLSAAKKLIDHEVDSLPVVKIIDAEENKNYEIIGRVTKTSITRLLVELGEGRRR
mgnify:FL=1